MIDSDLYSTKNRKGHKSAYLSGQVESPGIEPGSKQGSEELSTRLVSDWFFVIMQGRKQPHEPYLLFSQGFREAKKPPGILLRFS